MECLNATCDMDMKSNLFLNQLAKTQSTLLCQNSIGVERTLGVFDNLLKYLSPISD